MKDYLIPSIRATLLIALLTGLVFPFMMTLLCGWIFPYQANGSLLTRSDSSLLGSRLIAQSFSRPEYFHPRPSAAGSGYCGESSGGSNLGPCSDKLINGLEADSDSQGQREIFVGVKQLARKYRTENLLLASELVPIDAVTRSGSGLDPHISVFNAAFQARRIAVARGIELSIVLNLVEKHTEARQFGFLGEPRINVLAANLELDKLGAGKISSLRGTMQE